MIRFTLLFFGGLLLIALVVSACIRRIGPDEIGLHIMNIGSEKGLEPKDYDAGFYRSIWLVERWDTLPRSIQKVSYTNRIDLRGPDDQPAIEAKTLDGDRVTVEATIHFRVATGKGHSVYQSAGPGDAFKRLARDVSSPLISAAFATLGTQQIYDKEKRGAVYAKLESDTLRGELEARGLELIRVSILEVTYDPNFEIQFERQKVATQKTLLEKSQKKQAEEQGLKNSIVQEAANEVAKLKIELANEKKTREAQNKLDIGAEDAAWAREAGRIIGEWTTYQKTAEAKGIQAKKEAEAYAVLLQKEAFGDNGSNLVAYHAAQNFSVKNVTMSSLGIDWFSPASIAEKLGAIINAAAGAQK
ncbi:MAG: SPFH domain-containing protein [Planctomycetota bacterium]